MIRLALIAAALLASCGGTPTTVSDPDPVPAPVPMPVPDPAPAPDPVPADSPAPDDPAPAPEPVPTVAAGRFVLPSKVPPPPCDAAHLRTDDVDLSGDGKPDVRKIYLPLDDGSGGDRLGCKLSDLDANGVFDMVVLYDPAGQTYLEYMDFDYDGRFDLVVAHDPRTGKAVMTARDTDFDGVADLVETADPATP
jgi:hypothetical protein